MNIKQKTIKHLAVDGLDDVIKPPFFHIRPESRIFACEKWQGFLESLLSDKSLKGYNCDSPQSIRIPKGRYTQRYATFLSARDTAVLTHLVVSISDIIENAREDRKIVHSNRVNARGDRFLDRQRYDRFRKESSRLSELKKYSVKVTADISNYYDSINLHTLEGKLHELGCNKETVETINRILIGYADRHSKGIPVGTDAARLLAEAYLIDADKSLIEQGIRFVRYVDDYRIFCSSYDEAYRHLSMLSDTLKDIGLYLNTSKTKIFLTETPEEREETATAEFDAIDETEKIEAFRMVAGRYSSKISKYYKTPGRDALRAFRSTNLDTEIENINRATDPDEVSLRNFVKATIYKPDANPEILYGLCERFPHLISYLSHAVRVENERIVEEWSPERQKSLVNQLRDWFVAYENNDYIRIQCLLSLSVFDESFSNFIHKHIHRIDPKRELLLSQAIYISANKLQARDVNSLVKNYKSYGTHVRFAISWMLNFGASSLNVAAARAKIKQCRENEGSDFLRLCFKSGQMANLN